MTRAFRRYVLLAAIVGLGAAGSSLYVHYKLLTQAGYVSPCDINATFSCSQAYLSPYGSLFGVPVALFGFLWFGFVATLTFLAGRAAPPIRRSTPTALFAVSIVGLAMILYLAYAAFFILGELCVLCLVTYAAVIALFLLSAAAAWKPMNTLPRRLIADVGVLARYPLAVTALVLFAAAALSAMAFLPGEIRATSEAAAAPGPSTTPPADEQSDFEKWLASQPRENVGVPNDGAAVLIVKFNDYQCPPCRVSQLELRSVLARYEAEMPGAVRLVVKDFPWDLSCNPQAVRTLHPAACAAAVAVHMAEQHGRGPQLEEYLFSNQEALTPASVQQAAAWVGEVRDWNRELPAAMAAVSADVALAQPLRIRETPTFFINGIRLPWLATPDARVRAWDTAIRFELKRAGRLK